MDVMTEDSSSGGQPGEGDVPGPVPGPARVTGRQLRELLADDVWLDDLVDRADEGGVQLTGPAASSRR
jgi:hypothetical protein